MDEKQKFSLLKSAVNKAVSAGLQATQRLPVGAQLFAVAKGLIAPEDVRVGGVLRPEAASTIISMVTEDDFLGKITTEPMAKLTKEVQVGDILPRQLVRVAQGTEPTTGQMPGMSEYGCTLTAQSVQLFPTLLLSTLQDNADNPNFINVINASFNSTVQNDLCDLGINGATDIYANTFLSLSKGWLAIAAAHANVIRKTIDPATDGWIDSLAAIRAESDVRFRPTSVFVMSPDDADAYNLEVGKHVTGAALLATSDGLGFMRQAVVSCRYMPNGKVLYTPLKNIAFGMHKTITRTGAFHARRRVYEFTFDMAVDYEFIVKQAVVLGATA